MPTLKSLKVQRSRIRAGLTRYHVYCGNITESTSTEELETRLEAVKTYWEQYVQVEDGLSEFEQEPTADAAAAKEETFEQYESKYLYIYSTLLKAIRLRQKSQENASNTLQTIAVQQNRLLSELGNIVPKENDIALPKILIPKFSGEYSKWGTFRDLFLGSVDRKAHLTKTQKFYYLISYLDGEAADLIKNIPISDEHYMEAWDKLESRYNRPHLCAYSYIKTFLKLPSMTSTNHKTLRKIIDGADECLRGLKASEMEARDPWLIYLLLSKLDSVTRIQWSEEVGSKSNVSVYHFIEFLEKRYTYTESNEMVASTSTGKQPSVRSNFSRTSNTSCKKCKQQHKLFQCSEFINLDIEGRRKFIKDNSLCFNCLKSGHNASNCSSKYRCRNCNNRHNTLVHYQQYATREQESSTTPNRELPSQGDFVQSHFSTRDSPIVQDFSQTQHDTTTQQFNIGSSFQPRTTTSQVVSNHIFSHQPLQTILPTAIVRMKNQFGHFIRVRALVDSGSQVSFITESCVQLLGLRRTNARLSISGIASSNAGVTRGQVKINVYSSFSKDMVTVNLYILNRITTDIPSYNFCEDNKNIISKLNLADQNFNVTGPVDLLLGADVVWSILKDGKLDLKPTGLTAINSIFGWIIAGQYEHDTNNSCLMSFTVSTNIDDLLQRFWDIEQFPCEKHTIDSTNDDPAEIHFRSTHTKAADGKYIVKLPFNISNPVFENTLKGAISRLHNMERRFAKNKELKQLYIKFMNEYEQLGHMEKVPVDEIENTPHYYLPHHSILKPESSTTKLRVVFDGSFKDDNGKSLNNTLNIGPPIQRDLFGVSLRFRKYSFVFTADITKMFRQIWVCPDDRDYQRVVWRDDPSKPIGHYRLCTVTYGTSCAPFLSVRVLEQLANDNKTKYPTAASIILRNIYVDDVMAGAETEECLEQARDELISLLKQGGFMLRKWSSNSPKFLQNFPIEYIEVGKSSDSHIKLLGLYWNPINDTYSFRVAAKPNDESITKRKILSDTASIFDVFGFLSPSTILMKIFLQRLWLLKNAWDDPIPQRCFMLRRQTSQQLMANLPKERIQQHRPFFNTGCDIAGPITIKMTNCKRPRALHLELVSDLSSEAFILAFKRFISRRGSCCNLYCDNGTNFHGARRLLSEMHKMLLDETSNSDIASSIAKDGTTWHFIPPSSPHFGGIWESNVKSVKLHLKRVVGSSLLSYEEMYTVLTQIEAILNSRPLCPISDEDLNPLTPSHFIIGEPLTSLPEPNYIASPLPKLKHWKLLQQMVQGFWKRWSSEYITSLQQRPKWQTAQRDFSVGDIVVLKEPGLPPTKWLLGKIVQVHPGNDGRVRVQMVCCSRGAGAGGNCGCLFGTCTQEGARSIFVPPLPPSPSSPLSLTQYIP
ncbi:uncharacterized protein LOC142235958 [Haematobia irritans]|uniref:uncharacterized protein LOC142235958 n=1 Tax=Haematobia irritans TaxID=7368 RepID=UPI003F4FA910